MNIKTFCIILCLFTLPVMVLAHSFVPDYTTMKNLRCDFEEVIYNQDNSVVTKNNRFKLFKLDDSENKIYIQKEPVDNILYYDSDRIEFKLQSLTDDFIEMSHTVIDRKAMTYSSTSTMTYDNMIYGVRNSKSSGICKFIN